jgi:hypothetical protein
MDAPVMDRRLAEARTGVDSMDISHAATLEQLPPARDRIGQAFREETKS